MPHAELQLDGALAKLSYVVTVSDPPRHAIEVAAVTLPDEPITVYDAKFQPDGSADKKLVRAKLLVDAISRFLTTGGTFTELCDISGAMFDLPEISITGLAYQGSKIVGSIEHIFFDPKTDEFVRVVEGRFVDRMSLAQYNVYLAEVDMNDFDGLDS